VGAVSPLVAEAAGDLWLMSADGAAESRHQPRAVSSCPEVKSLICFPADCQGNRS
jgi:hypothetical protein